VKIRLDQALREWGLAPSRAKAQELLNEEAVEVLSGGEWVTTLDPAYLIENQRPELVRLKPNSVTEFVSRAGRKLNSFLNEIHLEVAGSTVLDIGISTGGFTDCVLQRGAKSVIGVDVGQGQLADKLKRDVRVTCLEKINARDLTTSALMRPYREAGFNLVLIDVSFISLRLVLPEAIQFVRPGGRLIALVKPQFEVGAEHLSKDGIVKDSTVSLDALQGVGQMLEQLGMIVENKRPSQVKGQDGNQEFLICALRP
jgi:23S rRNA (cytidine1920-2'-O)/16S rRNA (cytidine1409-2'-O)-methyltransferase